VIDNNPEFVAGREHPARDAGPGYRWVRVGRRSGSGATVWGWLRMPAIVTRPGGLVESLRGERFWLQ
jgi:hypothetical protein